MRAASTHGPSSAAYCTRSSSSALHALTSTHTLALAGTVFDVVPPSTTVGVTLVPLAASASSSTLNTWWASSTVALTPSCGSTPAWAALPRIISR